MSSPAPMRGHKWFAAFYDRLEKMDEKRSRELRPLVAGRAAGRVIEIGCGTGGNFEYYNWQQVETLDATEPDPYMLQRAIAKRDALPPDVRDRVTLHPAPAEALPFPDASFDCAVSTLVLCTVSNPRQAITELRRVLKPDGVLRLMEHVRAEGLAGLTLQRLIQPVWGWTAAGCHLDRPTEYLLQAAGFAIEVERRLRPMPILPMFVGEARVVSA